MLTTLATERLTIRNFRNSDWQVVHEMINQYESSQLAAYDHPWPISPEEIKKITAWFAETDGCLAVCLKKTGRFIGLVSLNSEPNEACRTFNLGYIFNFDYHGQDYATEAGERS